MMNVGNPSNPLIKICIFVIILFNYCINVHSQCLLKFNDRTINISKYRKIAIFQEILNKKRINIDLAPLKIEGAWDRRWQKNYLEYLEKVTKFGITDAEMEALKNQCITEAIWDQWTGEPTLTIQDRAYLISYSLEGHDYDRVLWDKKPSKNSFWLMWGPFQATFGGVNKLGGILKLIDPSVLKDCFGQEFASIQTMINSDDKAKQYQIFQSVRNSSARKNAWTAGLQCIGTTFEGQDAFLNYALESKFWIGNGIRKLYNLIPDAKSHGTEIDYAFLMDIAIQLVIDDRKLTLAKKAIQPLFASNPHPPRWMIRKAIGDAMIRSISRSKSDRMGRNVIYYREAAGNKLSAQELKAWQMRSPFYAENFGLSDEKLYYPYGNTKAPN